MLNNLSIDGIQPKEIVTYEIFVVLQQSPSSVLSFAPIEFEDSLQMFIWICWWVQLHLHPDTADLKSVIISYLSE